MPGHTPGSVALATVSSGLSSRSPSARASRLRVMNLEEPVQAADPQRLEKPRLEPAEPEEPPRPRDSFTEAREGRQQGARDMLEAFQVEQEAVMAFPCQPEQGARLCLKIGRMYTFRQV